MRAKRLNVGCGPVIANGWVNIDKSPSVFLSRAPWLQRSLLRMKVLTPEQAVGLPPGVLNTDVSRGLPFPDESVEFIYSGHMIEHMSRWQGAAFLRECHRVLIPLGVLRISTPDLALLMRSYVDREIRYPDVSTPADSFVREYGAFHEIEASRLRRLIHRMFSGAIHQHLYDSRSLAQVLSEAGFEEATECTFRSGKVPDLDVLETRSRGLFVEAKKR